jgi:hypothetical protein
MRNDLKKSKVSQGVYIALASLFLLFILGYEFAWRYDPKLDITINTVIRDAKMNSKNIIIHEQSDSPVDTSRRDYKDIRHGKTDIAICIEGECDTIYFSMNGKYISETRKIHISSDSSDQIILIPNTIQGLPTGSNMILFMKDDSLSLLEVSGFIADIDKDGNEEVNIPSQGGWVKLDAASGDWIKASLRQIPTP